ncbi:MAG: hypothetical protein EOP05_01880 [Proteobacteria bacterium]|nr:MAG: hypothetical protein EOP05_01880 [Pseudomonadota bacterium]
MSTSNIVYHFETREVLLGALLERISLSNIEKVSASQKPEFNAYERLLNHIEKNLEWADESHEGAQVLVQIYVSASHDKTFAKLYERMIDRAHTRIREHLLAGQREKLFGFTTDSGEMARTIHDLIVGAFIKIMASRLTTPIRYRSDEWKRVLHPLLQISTG